MSKTLATVLVGLLMIPASACPAAGGAEKEVEMHASIPEHAVYYLEIVTPDIDAAAGFYAEAFGWDFAPAAPELGGARVATLPDGSLCGIRAPMHEQEQPIVRTYLHVPDLDAAVAKAAELGAEIALPRLEIPGYGAVAIYFLGGIEQGVWQLP